MSVLVLPLPRWWEADAVRGFQDASGQALADEGDRRHVHTKLVDGEDAIAHHLSLGGEEAGKDQPRTVTQHQIFT